MPERRREEYNLACVGIRDRVIVRVKLRSWLGSRVWYDAQSVFNRGLSNEECGTPSRGGAGGLQSGKL